MIKLEIEPKMLYQLLISEARYGCSRNNHLMPDGAFDNIRAILPQFYDLDNLFGLSTVKQLCEEIIAEWSIRFPNPEDDDQFHNRSSYLGMIFWLLTFVNKTDIHWKPYNYNILQETLEKNNEMKGLINNA